MHILRIRFVFKFFQDFFNYFFLDDIVNSSIKKDKLHQIIHNYQQQNDLKKQLLVAIKSIKTLPCGMPLV
jgi:hypothetical protein